MPIGTDDKLPRGSVDELGNLHPLPGTPAAAAGPWAKFQPQQPATQAAQPATDWSKFVPDQPAVGPWQNFVPDQSQKSTIDNFLDGAGTARPTTIDDFLGPQEMGPIATLAQGFRNTGRAVGAAADVALDDRASVVERANAQAAAPKNEKLRAFESEIESRRATLGTDDPGLLDALGVVGGAVLAQPKGAGYAVLEQAPNAVAALAPAWAGAKLGATAGAAIPLPGAAPALGVVGGLAGLFLGNTALEVGNKAMEKAGDGVFTAAEREAAFVEGGTKAGVITGVDAATLGLSKWIMGATSRAVERATTRALADAGVDVGNEVAVMAARRSPEIVKAVRQAQQKAIDVTSTFGQKAARAGAALSLETVGEGLGDYLGELAATGQADMVDAVLESVLSLGQSGAEVAWGASKNAAALAAARLNPNAGPNSRAAIVALNQQAQGKLPPTEGPAAAGTMQQAAAAGQMGGDANNQLPPDWAQQLDAQLGGAPEQAQPSVPPWLQQYEQTSPDADLSGFVPDAGLAGFVPDANQNAIDQFLGTAPATSTSPAAPIGQQDQAPRLVPMKDRDAAARRAEVVARRTGIEQIVISHPTVAGRFAVVPADSPLATAPAAQAEGLDVNTLFKTQSPIPLKNARNLAQLLGNVGGTEHVVVPAPTGDGFGVVPADQLSPAQRDAWAGFQPGARRGAARRTPGPSAAPTATAAPTTTSPSTTSPTATPIGTPDAGSMFAPVTGATPQAAPATPAVPPDGAQDFNTEAQRVAPALPQIDSNTFTTAIGNAQSTIRRERWTVDGGRRFEGRIRAELERAGVPANAAQAVIDLAKQQTPADAFVSGDALAQAARSLGVISAASTTSTPDATPKPWSLSQDEFVKRVTFQKDGTRWSAQWNGQYLEGENEEFDHPTLGKTVVTGGRFFKTKREAALVARGAHKRAVRRALINGEQVAPEALALYPDLQPAPKDFARPADQAQNDTTPAASAGDPYDSIETRPDTTDAQRERGRSAVAALAARISAWSVRSGRGSAELLGSGLLESFAATGGTSLVGQTVRDAADLAALAQVLRNPRFETLRAVFTLGDKIVGQTAYSSRLPAAVYLPSDLHNHISHDKAGFGADGYFILHNHPSGKAEPSRSDINLTKDIAKQVPGFRAHVVIDRNQYATIGASGSARVIDAPELASVDFHSNPELKHDLLGLEVQGPGTLATIGKALQLKDGHASVIFTRRQGQVQVIMDLPAALLEDKSKLGVARLMAAVRRMARAAGAGGHRFVVLPQNGDVQALKHLVTRGIFTDVVDADGFGLQALGVHPGRDFLDKHKDARRVVEESGGAVQVAEDAADPYNAIEIRPNTTTAQLDAGRAAYADVQRRILSMRGQRIGAAVLGSRLAADIATTGGAQLIGQEVRDASDLAVLAQIYRNPNFETWRAFFVKDGKVVGEHAYSSRLPGAVILPKGIASRLKSEMTKYGADAVYTMHNHPRGSAMPSASDMGVAVKLKKEVPGWQGEVIIDSREYAVLTGAGLPPLEDFYDLSPRDLVEYGVKLVTDLRLASVDFASAPELEHRLLGLPIDDAADVAKLGKGLQVPDGHAAMIVTAAGKTQALLDVPIAPLLDTKTKLGRAKIMAMVRRIARATGGDSRYLVAPLSAKLDPWLVRFGVFQDVVSETGTSMLATVRKRAGNPDLVPLDQIGRNAMRNARQIYEPAGPGYDATESGTRQSRAAEPQQAEAVERFTPERRTAADWARGAIAANRPWMLGALTRDQIVDIWGKDLPQIVDFDRTVQSMDADRASIAQAADEIVERWRRLPSREADALGDLMHAATLAGFDPDTMNSTQPEHDQILADWNGLSDAAQSVYREARDTHRATLQAIRNGLADRAERTGSMGRQIADRIRLDFDQFLSDGVYFPLSRFGDLLLIADRNGERTVEAYESGTQREARARQLRADGWRVKMTSKSQYSAIRDGAAGAFTQEVMQHLEALDIDPAQKSQLFDTLNQLAISMLPDASYRRHFKHRKGTPGFSRDAMRGFAQAQQHAAHHIARIRHADQLVAALDDLQAQLSETTEGDVTEWQHVANELVRRLEQILNPNTHPVAAAAGQVGFVMSLGGSIASGLVNLSQTPLVFFPWAGSRFGFDKAAAALTKATRDYLGGKWDKWSGFVLSENPNIAPEERDALKRLEESGIINLTLAHDLAGAANADSTVSRRAFALNRAMKVVSWTFHLPETYNRQVSAIAAYRLAREAGQTHEDAIETARDGIVRSHFDYSASNRARYMHGNFIRVVTMFKQYSQQMTYMLWRNAWLALKGESAEVKSEARRMLFGVMSMHFAAAGSLGLPLGVFGISPLLSLLAMGSGDEDDPPLDWQDEYRLWLADTFGREGGEAIAKGPLRLLLDVDLASRVGLGDLWVRAPLKEKEGRDAVEQWMLTLLGPIAGYAGQMGTAMQAFEEGQFARGVESMMPKFIAAPLKALRYETEGVRSWRGDDLGVTLSDADIIGTAMGFQPTALSEMYSARATVKGREAALQRRREDLMRAWREARDAGDSTGLADAVASIRKFNEKNRPFAIGAQHLKASWMAHRRAQLQMAQGINLSRRRDELREFGRFAVID